MNAEKLKRLQAQVRIGGKGTPRRKKKVIHQTAATDDKKLQSSLKKLSISTIPGIEEVNIIKVDLTVIHFNNPKAQASLSANTFAVTGHGETKKIVEMLPEILPQLGQETVVQLRMFANSMSNSQKQPYTPGGGAAATDGANVLASVVEEDDDVPMLVSDFDEVAKLEATEIVPAKLIKERENQLKDSSSVDVKINKESAPPPSEQKLITTTEQAELPPKDEKIVSLNIAEEEKSKSNEEAAAKIDENLSKKSEVKVGDKPKKTAKDDKKPAENNAQKKELLPVGNTEQPAAPIEGPSKKDSIPSQMESNNEKTNKKPKEAKQKTPIKEEKESKAVPSPDSKPSQDKQNKKANVGKQQEKEKENASKKADNKLDTKPPEKDTAKQDKKQEPAKMDEKVSVEKNVPDVKKGGTSVTEPKPQPKEGKKPIDTPKTKGGKDLNKGKKEKATKDEEKPIATQLESEREKIAENVEVKQEVNVQKDPIGVSQPVPDKLDPKKDDKVVSTEVVLGQPKEAKEEKVDGNAATSLTEAANRDSGVTVAATDPQVSEVSVEDKAGQVESILKQEVVSTVVTEPAIETGTETAMAAPEPALPELTAAIKTDIELGTTSAVKNQEGAGGNTGSKQENVTVSKLDEVVNVESGSEELKQDMAGDKEPQQEPKEAIVADAKQAVEGSVALLAADSKNNEAVTSAIETPEAIKAPTSDAPEPQKRPVEITEVKDEISKQIENVPLGAEINTLNPALEVVKPTEAILQAGPTSDIRQEDIKERTEMKSAADASAVLPETSAVSNLKEAAAESQKPKDEGGSEVPGGTTAVPKSEVVVVDVKERAEDKVGVEPASPQQKSSPPKQVGNKKPVVSQDAPKQTAKVPNASTAVTGKAPSADNKSNKQATKPKQGSPSKPQQPLPKNQANTAKTSTQQQVSKSAPVTPTKTPDKAMLPTKATPTTSEKTLNPAKTTTPPKNPSPLKATSGPPKKSATTPTTPTKEEPALETTAAPSSQAKPDAKKKPASSPPKDAASKGKQSTGQNKQRPSANSGNDAGASPKVVASTAASAGTKPTPKEVDESKLPAVSDAKPTTTQLAIAEKNTKPQTTGSDQPSGSEQKPKE